jgi:hypothetical protein
VKALESIYSSLLPRSTRSLPPGSLPLRIFSHASSIGRLLLVSGSIRDGRCVMTRRLLLPWDSRPGRVTVGTPRACHSESQTRHSLVYKRSTIHDVRTVSGEVPFKIDLSSGDAMPRMKRLAILTALPSQAHCITFAEAGTTHDILNDAYIPVVSELSLNAITFAMNHSGKWYVNTIVDSVHR